MTPHHWIRRLDGQVLLFVGGALVGRVWYSDSAEHAAAIWLPAGAPNLDLVIMSKQEKVEIPVSTLAAMLRSVGYAVTAPEPPPQVADWCACDMDSELVQ